MKLDSHCKFGLDGHKGTAMIPHGRYVLIILVAAFGLASCISSGRTEATVPGGMNWPVSGIGKFCKGNEPLSVGLEAARAAFKLKRAIGTRHARKQRQEIRELKDKAQCIFAAHARRGEPEGMYRYALTLLARTSGGSTTDYRHPPNARQEVTRLLTGAARQGHVPAFIAHMKTLSARKKGIWINKAAEAGNIEAQHELGAAHLVGGPYKYGIPRDSKAAEKWLNLAAQRGHVFAALALGGLYERGATGVEMDKRKALTWLEPLLASPPVRSADRGFDPQAPGFSLQLARLYCAVGEREKALAMYQRGHNVGEAEARKIMTRACP